MGFTNNIDKTLEDIAISVSLDDSRLERIKSSYRALLDLLKNDKTFFCNFDKKITIFPQGSVRLGTTIKPKMDDFDLDIVIHIDIPYQTISFKKLYTELYRVFYENKNYKDKIEKKNRCIRINYKNDYHMDLLPAVSYDSSGALAVPDKQANSWTISNPEAFAKWFLDKAKHFYIKENFAKSENLNLKEFSPIKNYPLKSAIKILKMYNTEYYVGEKESLKVPSIILTTLAAKSYNSSDSIIKTLNNFISYIESKLFTRELLHFNNPAEKRECYSERWEENKEIYDEFKKFILDLKFLLNKIINEKNTKLQESLLKSLVSNENYYSGFEYFSNRERINNEKKGDYSGLITLAKPKSLQHRPYFNVNYE